MKSWIGFLVLMPALSMAAVTPSPAAPDTSLERCRETTRGVMRQVAANNDKNAFDMLQAAMPMDADTFAQIRENSLKQRKNMPETVGASLGYKLVLEDRVSDFLVRLTYAERREKNMLRWQFFCYRGKTDWHISAFFWDANVAALFDLAATR